ncbi:hypothetical protein SPIROBIBN47_370025 [uncultured spirochete]|jgi:hypothetical protein|uniref:Uncharacterized protein n=1 Tax=uncultured spirochete TaxID=156406 RepID=A0A3P3XKQ1_9SPIR|nr:hypothetical protein [Rectinema subterraneum]SLM14922.1 hypothetical protein SPIROBIBN47_370025 [uncultured spirochete]
MTEKMKLLHLVRRGAKTFIQVQREKATGMLDFELKELENIFALLLLGGFAGIPSPPAPIAIELLPYLEREIVVLLARSDLSTDPIGALMGMLEID